MFDEQEIQKMMKNLSLTREEAIQLLKDDENDITTELTAEQQKVVKAMVQSDRKKETTPRKRERKPDDNKRALVNGLTEFLDSFSATDITVENIEREILFRYNDELFRIVLMKPREKK